jgi:hypothetical protein
LVIRRYKEGFMRIALCVGAGLALLAGPALAQRNERPEVKVWDRWQFVRYYSVPSTKPNLVWEINSVTATAISGTENGEPLLMTPDLNVVDSPTNKQSNPKALSFPLEVGKRWRFASDWLFKPKGSKGSIVVDVEVVAHEKVEVPAGEFEAFKLVSKGRVSGTSPINSQYDAVITTTYWYAAAARTIVKSVTHNPYLGVSTVEMVAYELRP